MSHINRISRLSKHQLSKTVPTLLRLTMRSRQEAAFNNDCSVKADGMSMIVVMGVTGSGKSYLINRLAGKEVVAEGEDIYSCK